MTRAWRMNARSVMGWALSIAARDLENSRRRIKMSDEFQDWLHKQAASVAGAVEKDLTVGDVHRTTALGNEDKKKKKPKPVNEDEVTRERTAKTLANALR